MVDVVIKLSIKKSATSGYTQATNGDGNAINYWYKFSDGTDGNGNVDVKVPGNKTTVAVKLTRDTKKDYDILTALWKDIPTSDMRIVLTGPDRLKIINDASQQGTNRYSVIASPAPGPHKFILCDPRISNNWDEELDPPKSPAKAKKKVASKKAAKKPAKQKASANKKAPVKKKVLAQKKAPAKKKATAKKKK